MTDKETFRQNLIEALHRELIGPPWLLSKNKEHDNGINTLVEVLQESPVQRYSAGVLFPSSQPIIELEDAEIIVDEVETDDIEAETFAVEQVMR